MPQLLSDDDVFGAAAKPGRLLSDDEVLGRSPGASAPAPAAGLGEIVPSVLAGINKGTRGIARAAAEGVQAPVDTLVATLANIPAAADRLVTLGLNKVNPSGNWKESESLQKVGRTMSAIAAETRAANVNSQDDSALAWLNPRTAIARFGLGLEQRLRADQAEEDAAMSGIAPNVQAQARAISDADGIVGTAKAIAQNPVGMLPSLAESLPAMALGVGVAGKVGGAAARTGAAQADAAAARVAAAGGDATAQAAARSGALQAAEQSAVSRASAAGAGVEAATSAAQSGDQAFDTVMATPLERLQAQSARFRELVAQLGNQAAARQHLAEEVRDQTKGLVAVATFAGTKAVNRVFGEDTTARLAAGVGKSSWKDVPKNMLHEGTEEVAQGIGQDLAEHGAATQADPAHKLDLGGSAVQNFVAGAAMGGPTTAGKVALDKVREVRAAPAVTPDARSVPENVPAVPDSARTVTTDAEKALFQPRDLTALDRVQSIDAELPKVRARLAELNRADAGYGPAFDTERQELAQRDQELQQEREQLAANWPKPVQGAETSFTTEAGARVQARYGLVDAGDLVTSHDEGLRKNDAYPAELQPRERERAASEMQVSGIAQRLDPARLGLSADAATGAPIIGADGLVESGNARSIALKRIYRVPGEKAEAYKAWLRDNAESFGIHAADVDLMDRPVLVRVRQTPVDRVEFARQANASTVAAMSPTEQARSDAARIDSLEDLQPDEHGDFSGAGSRDFVRRFMARLPATEQAGMIDSSGRLSTAGYARVRNAVLARAYGDSPVLARMTESLDDNLRNISRALIASAPRVAQMRDAIAAGVRHDADLTPHILSAVEELSRLKEEGRSVEDELAQAGLLGDKYSAETADVMRFLADNIRRPRRIADFIAATVQALDAAGDPHQASMFGDAAAPQAADLIQAARRAIDEQVPADNAERGEPSAVGASPGEQPAAAQSSSQRDQSAGPADTQAGQQRHPGESWSRFPAEFGSLNIPRAEMPQLRGEARGALVNFLEARGIGHEMAEVPAVQLKPSQAEYSPDKVRGWAKVRDGSNRSVLVASDGRILDGHHQWMDALARGADVKTVRFNAPFDDLRAAVAQFPSTEVSDDSLPKLTPEQQAQLDEMRAQAEASKPEFDAALREIASAVGGDVQLAKIKSAERASAKALADYDGDVSMVKDLLRGTVVAPSPQDAGRVIAALESRFKVLASGRRNHLGVDSVAPSDGYRDAKMIVRMPSGIVAEIQVNVPEMLDANKRAHPLYEERQRLERTAGAASEGKRRELDAQMRSIYAAAWASALAKRESQSAAVRGEPSEKAVRGVNGRGEGLSKAVPSARSSENREARGDSATGMSSTSQNDVPSGKVDEAGTLAASTAESGSRFMDTSKPILSAEGSEQVDHVRGFADAATANWAAPPEIVVVHSMSDPQVPAEVRELDAEQKSQGASGEVEGFFHKGAIYLVADALPNKTAAQRVLFHEALGHFGLRSVFGDGLRPILMQLGQARPDLVKPKAEAYGLDFGNVEQRLQAAEEVLAELAQTRPELGFVQRTVSAIRNWLRANVPGFGGLKLTDTDIIAGYILPARGWVERGRGAGAAVGSTAALSRRTFDTSKTVTERADEIIANRVNTRAPVDAAFRFVVNDVAKLPKIIDASIRGASFAIDRALAMLPQSAQDALHAGAERVRAGIVSDYGVPDAVIDQRALLQGRQRVQLRQAGKLVDALSSLTRAESRVAYAWLNEADPHEAARLMDDLPADSVKVLGQVAQMIDWLSQDAVALGQLSGEAFERHRFAYLRRSYAKHVLDQQTPEGKARRSRAIAVLGEQYKGRGLVETASMRQMQALAPEWWQRKLEAGKADTSLKGAQFVRLEKRAASGEGTSPLEGMDGKAKGRLQEVAYYPAGEELPAKYADWDRGETFEVRDVQKDKLVLWRDFTKAEREQMGEVDEARFAIAKTLHGMIHDVEVGRYMEWLAHKYAIKNEAAVPGELVDASEAWRHTFKPGEWVQVPDSKIQGTDVAKYGKLAGRYLPGPVWNDLRQTVGGQFKPFGETFSKVLTAWKTAKTALSPAVHTNNIVSNFVMADWHDVSAAHTAKALRILLGAHDLGGEGALGRAGNAVASAGGIADREAAQAIVTRYRDSGGDIGSWATQEVAREQLEPLLAAIQAEADAGDPNSPDAQLAAASALELLRAGELKAAAVRAGASTGKSVVTEARTVIDLYQSEDEVFRLARWLKAKEEGATDLEAGKLARESFMDYSINAPWIQAMRATAFPFIAYTYRAAPMLLDIARRKPHKLLKLMTLAAAANYLGVMMGGGGDDKERKLLPEEKAGRIWGLVPKLIRMPWNDANGSPVYLDIRRFIPVGDVVDLGAGHSAIPLPPSLQPGGPLAMIGEIALNQSAFTGKPITLETDTAAERTQKVMDYLYKWATPNVLGLPGSYATTGVADAAKGRTDAFGREQSVGQAVASSFGLKLGSYPADVLRRQLYGKLAAETMEIDKNIAQLRRQRQTNQISPEEFGEKVRAQQDKKLKLQREASEKFN